MLNTDLNTYNADTDTEDPFWLESLSLGLGLEWKVRVYGTRQVGIRSSYNYCNFSRNNELRSNLGGGYHPNVRFLSVLRCIWLLFRENLRL